MAYPYIKGGKGNATKSSSSFKCEISSAKKKKIDRNTQLQQRLLPPCQRSLEYTNYLQQRGETHRSSKTGMYHDYDTKLHLVVRL